jgi:hypothetical protein
MSWNVILHRVYVIFVILFSAAMIYAAATEPAPQIVICGPGTTQEALDALLVHIADEYDRPDVYVLNGPPGIRR